MSGMIVVAIVMEEAEWDKIISDELEDFERRTLATEISDRAKMKMHDIENE